MSEDESLNRGGVAALVSMIVLAELALVIAGVFGLIFANVDIDDVMIGILGSIVTGVFGLGNLAAGFWLGSSAGSKRANGRLADIANSQGGPLQAENVDVTAETATIKQEKSS